MMKKLITLLFFVLFTNNMLIGQVAPFLTTTWNQGCNYNASCPTISGGQCGKAYTGCNATAFGQICKYYSFPTSGIGSHSYTPPSLPTQSVNFASAIYNYTAMPNAVSAANPDVATLLYHCGVLEDMQYSASNSVSFFDGTPWKRYFKYSPKMYPTATFMFSTTADLINAIKAELNAGRPVYAKGGGHFYLIDGYNASNQFHMNFGWGGTYNGYYAINSVVNGAGTFTPVNFMFNIRPMAGSLEIKEDTIVAPATAGMQFFEFTSLSNWTISTSATWLTSNLTSGTAGYFNNSDNCKANLLINNGPVRYGYLYVQNAGDVDTIVVKQNASPLSITPNMLNYVQAGGSQSIAITATSGWTATPSAAWVNLSPATGTGNGSLLITALSNPGAPRNSFVVITSGVFSDTVLVNQSALATNLLNNRTNEISEINLFPNPTNGILFIELNDFETKTHLVELIDALGKVVLNENTNSSALNLNLTGLPDGFYYLKVDGTRVRKVIKN